MSSSRSLFPVTPLHSHAPPPLPPPRGDVTGHPQGRVPWVAPSHGGPIPQVTGGARGWADAFPEDTVADHVGDTQGRRYYRHLSDDEDLVASGGEATPGGTRVGGWVQMPAWVPLAESPRQMALGRGGKVALGGSVAPGMGVTLNGCRHGLVSHEWVPLWCHHVVAIAGQAPGLGGIWW